MGRLGPAFELWAETEELLRGHDVSPLVCALEHVHLMRKTYDRVIEAFLMHNKYKLLVRDDKTRDHALIEREFFWARVLQMVKNSTMTMHEAEQELHSDEAYQHEREYMRADYDYKEAMREEHPAQRRLKSMAARLKQRWDGYLDEKSRGEPFFSPVGHDVKEHAKRELADHGT